MKLCSLILNPWIKINELGDISKVFQVISHIIVRVDNVIASVAVLFAF